MSHELAELLFPHIQQTPAHYFEQYPPRALPSGAWVSRFAPSPTGFVHIGSLMAALVESKVAHQTDGVFFLRIEDTDKKREQDGSIEAIVQNLINFGLTPDEGIVQINPEREVGAYAPYTQSERKPIYETFAKFLVQKGFAYPCFATEAELTEIRKRQEARKVKPGYYGEYAIWRNKTIEDVKAQLAQGHAPAIRIRAPYPNPNSVRFHDHIKGDLEMPGNDQDMVLLKSDNALPTYHFAHPIDDTLMRVNIVIRGEEWLPSVPLHIMIFESLELPLPGFAHIAPIAKMDGSSKRKLSKRKDPEAAVSYYHEAGYPRQAVIEYLLNLANSDFEDWRKANPGVSHTEFKLKLDHMSKSSPLFDLTKLNDISKEVIATYTAEQVYEHGLAWAEQFAPDFATILKHDPAYSIAIFNIERGGDAPRKDLVKWEDMEASYGFLFDHPFQTAIAQHGYTWGKIAPADVHPILTAILQTDYRVSKDEWLNTMRAHAETMGFARDNKTYKKAPDQYKGHFGDFMMVMRVALTGKTNTPDLYEILHTIGSERVQARLAQALTAAQ